MSPKSKEIQPLQGGQLILLTLSLSLGIFMNVLDISIANVSIPPIAGDLAVSPNQATWVITSFAVSQAIVLPITGWLARRFGEVRLFVISTLLFTLVSIFCGLAYNLTMLVTFRVIQGAVSGPMIPLSQSLLLANYPSNKQGLATGLWSMTAVVAPVLGPVLGGWITDNYTWPWIFYINLPVGLFSFIVTWVLLKDRETQLVKSPIDRFGLILLILGVGSLQILLDKGKDLDWFDSNIITILGVVSFVSICFLIVWETTAEHPIIDLSLFKIRNFCVGTIAISCGFMVYFGNVVIFPLWLQTQMGYTPTWAGFAAAPIGIIPVLLTPFVGQYMVKFDLRYVVGLGFLIFAFTAFWSSGFYTDVGYIQVVMPRFFQGFGITLFFTPLLGIVLSGLPANRLASALGLVNFCRILGASFGTSLSVTLWDRREAFHHAILVEQINQFNPVSISTLNRLKEVGFSGLKNYELLVDVITNQAYMLATNEFFWLSGWIFLTLLLVISFAKPPFMSYTKVVTD